MDHDIEKVALLREPVRRRLFDHVRLAAGPVSREEAASAVGVSRSLAAFHLDKLAGGLLLEALEGKAAEETPEDAARRVAERRGRALAGELVARSRRRSGLARIREALEQLGFEPEEEKGTILLHNCPFHELMRRDPSVVCGMNDAFVTAIADELAPSEARAAVCDREGYCCVMLERA